MISISRGRRPHLTTIRRHFDRWRQTRSHPRAPLPPRLWAAAVALVPEYGVYGTARALGVSYGALQQHVQQPAARPGKRRRTRFVELPPASVTTTPVIEVEDAAGRTVRVRLAGVGLADLADFTRRVVGATS